MSRPESYRQQWSNPHVYETFEERRKFVTPALCQMTEDVVSHYFEAGDTVLEVGAGGGALRRYAGAAVDNLTWIESEHRLDFLQLPREHRSLKAVAGLPELPVKPASLQGIISLGVFDTLSTHDLKAGAQSMAEALAPGGRLIHLLDMSPDMGVEVKNARREGRLPLPFNETEGEQTIGLHYVALKNVSRRIDRLPVEDSIKNVFVAYARDPEIYLPQLNRTNTLSFLGQIAAEHGMVVATEPSWLEALSQRLGEQFEAAGLTTDRSEIISSQLYVNEHELPPEIQGKGANHIVRRQGAVDVYCDPNLMALPGKVLVQADTQLVVASKPLT